MTSTVNEEVLLQWLEENNVRLHPKIEIKKSEFGGIGVYAKEDLDPTELVYHEEFSDTSDSEDESEDDEDFEFDEDGKPIEKSEQEENEIQLSSQPLVRIPKSTIFSAKNSFISNLLEEEDINGIIGLILAFIYEYEQAGKSPWFGYFQSFDFNSIDLPPSFWKNEQKQWFKGTEVELLNILNNGEISNVMDICCEFAYKVNDELKLPIPKVLTKDNDEEIDFEKLMGFAKISVLISSRCFNIDNYHEFALVPAADLFNHSSNDCNAHFESNFEVCEICGNVGCDHVQEDVSEDEWEDEEESNEEEEEEEEDNDEEMIVDEEFISYLEGNADDEDEEKEKEEKVEEDEEVEENPFPVPEYLQNLKHDDGNGIFSVDCCDIVLHGEVSKGSEIFSTYGDLNNAILLLKYQFVEFNNANDYVSLSKQILEYKKTNPKLNKRFNWWKEIGYDVFKDWMRQVAKDDEEDEDDEEDDDEEESWLSDLKLQDQGDISTALLALVNLIVLKDSEFSLYFEKDKKKKINDEKYFQKVLKNLSKLMNQTKSVNNLLSKLILQRQKTLNQNTLVNEKFNKISGEIGSAERRKSIATLIVNKEKSILNSAINRLK